MIHLMSALWEASDRNQSSDNSIKTGIKTGTPLPMWYKCFIKKSLKLWIFYTAHMSSIL